jgi:hypothetical protein
MAVMDVGIVRMRVFDRGVTVWVCVRLLAIPVEVVRMLVMAVVTVFMHMVHRRVLMFMLVGLRQMQPDSAAHQRRGDPERTGSVAKNYQGNRRADKRGRRGQRDGQVDRPGHEALDAGLVANVISIRVLSGSESPT